MLATFSLILSLSALALAVALALVLRRAGRSRQELAQRLHDRALALDERCDALQRQLDDTALCQRVDHLLDLVRLSEKRGALDVEAARDLERFVIELREGARG